MSLSAESQVFVTAGLHESLFRQVWPCHQPNTTIHHLGPQLSLALLDSTSSPAGFKVESDGCDSGGNPDSAILASLPELAVLVVFRALHQIVFRDRSLLALIGAPKE